MKTNILYTLALLLICTLGYSQSFEKGDILIDAGIGIGIYGTKVTTTTTNGNTTVSREERDEQLQF